MNKENLVKCKDDCECFDCVQEKKRYFWFIRKELTDDDAFVELLNGFNDEVKGVLYRREQDVQNIFFKKGVREGAKNELEIIQNWCNLGGLDIISKLNEIHKYCEKRLKEL